MIWRAATLLGKACLRRSALLQIFARVFALAADEAFARRFRLTAAGATDAAGLILTQVLLIATSGKRRVCLRSEVRLAGAALALLTGFILIGRLTEFGPARSRAAGRLRTLGLLAVLLLGLLALFLLAALAGRLIVTLLPDWGLLSAAFVLIALSHADFLS